MKSLKYISFALVALMVLASCNKETDPWTPGQPTNPNGYNVYFSDENPASYTLGLSDNSFVVTVERESGASALSVPLTTYSETTGIFTAPSTVEFAAGETSKDITVQFQNADPFVSYSVTLSIPEEYTKPYADQEVYPIFSASVLQEDYKVVASGTYTDAFWYEESKDQDLEYSELQDTYRFSDIWTVGYGFSFKWDKSTNTFTLPAKFQSGIVSSSYGMISATAQSFSYDEASKTLTMNFKWTVSAGSFGVYPNYFTFN